jgi:hypothetical protein
MSNSNFVVTQSTPNPSGIVSLGSIISPAPFFDPVGNLNMNGLDIIGTATTATNVTITEDNTSSVPFYPVFVSDNTGNLDLKVDKTTTPLSYTPSTGEFLSQSFAATVTNGTVFSRLSSTQLQIYNVPSNMVTISSNQITMGPTGATLNPTIITPTTVNATTFVTNTPPAAANQLGNKTYIDNFGGSGGWYFTSTVSVTASTTVTFSNCLNNLYNAYEIYFVPSLSAPTTGFPTLDMTFGSIPTPAYQSWSQTQTTGVSFTNSYLTTAPRLMHGLDFSNFFNRQATIKLDLWGTRNLSGGSGASRFSYLSEGFSSTSPSAWIKNFGTVQYSVGTITSIILTYSVAVTGSITIVVKAKY